MGPRRLALIIALLSVIVFANSSPASIVSATPGVLTGKLPRTGLGLAVWGGGSPEELAASAQTQGCRIAAFWVSTGSQSDGAFVGYVFGAPSVVNAAFILRLPGSMPAATPVIVDCSRLSADGTAQQVTFTRSVEDFRNPGRGVQRSYEDPIGSWTSVDADQTTPRRYMRLPVSEEPLSPALLDGVRRDLAFARSAGLLLDLRFYYSGGFDQPEPSFAAILRHQAQLAPIVRDYSAIINTLELGLIGPWGEGHSSTATGLREGDDAGAYPRRLQLLRGWLNGTPSSVIVTLRFPHQLRWMIERGGLSAAEATRTGTFIDGFLGNVDHGGTFRGSWTDLTEINEGKLWLETFSKTHSSRGEANVGSTATADYANAGSNWLTDGLARYHIDTLREWGLVDLVLKPKNVWEDVKLRLGYRLVLKDATLPVSVAAGDRIKVTFTLDNEGYAPPRRALSVRLMLGSNAAMLDGVDPRDWQPGSHVITADVRVPPLRPGVYPLSLGLVDSNPALSGDPRYSIRLANSNIWQAESGLNALGATVQVR